MPSKQPLPSTVRVLVADSSVIHTELLAQALAKDRRITVAELSASGSGVLTGVRHSNPDVLLISETLDHRPTSGLEILRAVRTERPDLKAVVLLDSPKQENVVQAFRAGARGVFCRNQPVKVLCKCISVVNEGQIWANSQELVFLLEALAATPSLLPASASGLTGLSERERDVVACLAQGLSNRDIAVRLAISQHTVKNYMFRIFEKIGVSSRVELLFFLLSGNGEAQEVLKRPITNQRHEAGRRATATTLRVSPPKASTSTNRNTSPRTNPAKIHNTSADILSGLPSADRTMGA